MAKETVAIIDEMSQVVDPDLLTAFLQKTNIAEDLDEKDLKEIGRAVFEEYELDEESRSGWLEENKTFLKLARELPEDKYVGADRVANVRYPIISTACISFSSRCYPNIVKGSDVVNCQTVGSDPNGVKAARAQRVKQHMGYQVLNQMDGWEEGVDQLFMSLPLTGCMFKKTYYDTVEKLPVSELIFPDDLVVHYHAKSLDAARRVTHIIRLSPNEIEERIRSGEYLDFKYEGLPSSDEDSDDNDKDKRQSFLEQHRWWDMDDDGYQEPYVVTIHKDTQETVKIIPRFDSNGITRNEKGIVRIKPVQYFTQFTFLPAFDGNFYRMGFGMLLSSPVNIINTVFNQLLDAGTLANRQGGFVSHQLKVKKSGASGIIRIKQGEWKQISFMGDDIRRHIMPLPAQEPSNVLFQLLGLMLEAVKELASQADVLSGEQPKGNVPATTTLALIEQGLKVFSAVYKRIYRSLKSEFTKIRRINTLYLESDEYNNIIDSEVRADAYLDYSDKFMDIIPVSGSADVSDTQRVIKAQALIEMMGQGLNDDEIRRRYLEALQIPDVERLLETEEPPPDPKYVIEEEKLRLKNLEIQLDAKRQLIEEQEKLAKITKYEADSIKAIADAEAVEEGTQIDAYKARVKEIENNQKFIQGIMGQLNGGKEGEARSGNNQGAV